MRSDRQSRSRAGHSDCSGRRRRRWQGLALALLRADARRRRRRVLLLSTPSPTPPLSFRGDVQLSLQERALRKLVFQPGFIGIHLGLKQVVCVHVGAQVRQRQKDWLPPRARAPHFACMTVLHCRFLVTKKGVDLFRCGVFCSSAGHTDMRHHRRPRRPPSRRTGNQRLAYKPTVCLRVFLFFCFRLVSGVLACSTAYSVVVSVEADAPLR